MSNPSKSLLLKSFHKQLFDFLDDIISIVPDNQELVKSKVYFTTLKQANPTLIIKIWYQYIFMPYRDLIESGNVDFFLEKDYTEDLQYIPYAADVLRIIDTSIRNPIKEMEKENKEKCAKYIQLLTKISVVYAQ
jgi:predicted component of viral defense system (DUF524 family)